MEAQQSDKISVASKRSSRSSTASSSSLIRARAKAEAARTHLAFAEQEAKAKIERAAKEAEHQKEKADREATYQLEKAKKDVELEALTIRREAAMAEAEAAVWEAADGMEKYMLVDEVGPSEEDKMRRTKEYIRVFFCPYTLTSTRTHIKAILLPTPQLSQPLKLPSQHVSLLIYMSHQGLR
jgi:hypothetical protein